MSADPFIGEITMFVGNFAPRNWAFCNGQLLDISSHTSLFSIIGTTYGGDGRSTFALPDLRGRSPVHFGQGPGLSPIPLGEAHGNEQITLTEAHLPSHSHFPQSVSGAGTEDLPTGHYPADEGHPDFKLYGSSANGLMGATTSTGGSQAFLPHAPRLSINFIIALEGIYPSRS